jgi:hypothetical protein
MAYAIFQIMRHALILQSEFNYTNAKGAQNGSLSY